MSKFPWGRPIEYFTYDFDGRAMEVVKYHPWKVEGCTVKTGSVDIDKILYHCDSLHESCGSLFHLVIAFIAKEQLGLNQYALVIGIAKSLDCYT